MGISDSYEAILQPEQESCSFSTGRALERKNRHHRRILEQAVMERTSQLVEANRQLEEVNHKLEEANHELEEANRRLQKSDNEKSAFIGLSLPFNQYAPERDCTPP